MTLELLSFAVGAVGLAFGVSGIRLARKWSQACSKCRIIVARKGKVVLDAPLTEWLLWEKNMPQRDGARGGTIFHANGVQVAIARPKVGAPSATTKTRTVKEPKSSGGVGPTGAARRAAGE